ncbi:MAG: HAD family hydrolase [Dehalococcoidales bacterium]|nr:HAD family hydrolase [Dehalococcoidales bacterium]
MIKAVFFDWFNTLACYYPPREELESQALKELGFDVSPKAISPGLYLADKNFYEENARLPIRERNKEAQMKVYTGFQWIILKEAGIAPTDDLVLKLMTRMLQLNASMKFVLFDDVRTTLKAIKQKNLKVGLLTNLQSEVNSMCRELGIADYLDFTVTSAEVGADKPQPPIFLKALELAQAKASEAMHIGDQYQNDVQGARAVGIQPVLLDRADYYAEITDCPRIRSLTEVVKLIR